MLHELQTQSDLCAVLSTANRLMSSRQDRSAAYDSCANVLLSVSLKAACSSIRAASRERADGRCCASKAVQACVGHHSVSHTLCC